MYTVNVQGQLFDAEKVAKAGYICDGNVPLKVAFGDAWNISSPAWHALGKETQDHHRIEGLKVGLVALSQGFCNAKRESISYKSSYESIQNSYAKLQETSNDNSNKLKAAEAEVIALKAINARLQAQIQPFDVVSQELAQVMQELLNSKETIIQKSQEIEQGKREREKLESDINELQNSIATLKVDHAAKIKKIKKKHEASTAAELKVLKTMIAKLSAEYGSDTDTSHN